MSADLHLHSTISDGLLAPSELVHQAAEAGVQIMALTDHDATDGIAEAMEAAQDHPGLVVIPGIELSTDVPAGEVHMLGYFINVDSRELQETLASFRKDRVGRAQDMVERLVALNMPLDWERVQEIAGEGAIGRPHIAEALLERGYVTSIKDAFDRFIGRSGPAYAERRKMAPIEAIALIRRHGGAASMAHPRETPEVEKLLPELVAAGLTGMEVYYGLYPEDERQRLLDVCERFGLLPTGGSDYHGPGRAAECPLGESNTPLEIGERLLALQPRSQR